MYHYCPGTDEPQFFSFTAELSRLLRPRMRWRKAIVILCIGTPLLFADSFGPLTGTLLRARPPLCKKPVYVYGSLSEPVTAINYAQIRRLIMSRHPRALIIAVDAALGAASHVGTVALETKALAPASGVPNRSLAPVGHLSVTGIVQNSDMPDWYRTQLSFSGMYEMAHFLAEGISRALSSL